MANVRWGAAVAAWLAVCAAAAAHDFWIQPSPWHPAPGALVKIDLRIGDDLPGESFPRKSTIIDKFEIVDPAGKVTEVAGRDAAAPAGLARPQSAGIHVLSYRSKPSAVELDAAKFEHYLGDKGLEKVIDARSAAGQTTSPGREMYSRCAKTIVRVGEGGPESGFDRVLGYTLEIVADVDPTRVNAGEAVKAHLLYQGKPCAGVLILAKCLSDGKTVLRTRSGAEGRFDFVLPSAGQWMFTAVEMVKAPAGAEINGVKPEWESLWASLTFESAGVSMAMEKAP